MSYDSTKEQMGNYRLVGIRYVPLSVTGGGLPDSPSDPKYRYQILQGASYAFLLNVESGKTWALDLNTLENGWSPFTDNQGTANPAADNRMPDPTPPPLSSENVNAVEINKKPLTDFADEVASRWGAKEIDLNQSFSIVLNGVLTKEGKLDRDKSKFDVSKQTGDPKMIDIGKAALEALSDSGYLTYLSHLGADKVTAALVQDDDQITVVISSSQKTPERAKSIASAITSVILIGKTVTKNPSDERTLLDSAAVTSDGTNFVLNFTVLKPIAQEMMTRWLKDALDKKARQP